MSEVTDASFLKKRIILDEFRFVFKDLRELYSSPLRFPFPLYILS